MGKFIDLSGLRFGRLSVLRRMGSASQLVMWECKCDCGATTTASTKKLRNGRRVSCGCFRLESAIASRMKHGHSSGRKISPEMSVWMGMRARCNNPSSTFYHRYGGRGIRVCERWDDFAAFFADMGPRPSRSHTIERKDNNGGYAPENCVWATVRQQMRNRRSNIYVLVNGQSMCVADAASATGIGAGTLYWRVKRGWPESRLFEPTNQ